MSIDHNHLREYVIRPTLKYLGLHSRSAEELLVGTAAVESEGGHYLHQLGDGPAIGIFQMEPATHDDIWDNYLNYRSGMGDAIKLLVRETQAESMAGNLYYATAMARAHYMRVPTMLPPRDELRELAQYWKDHYNTRQGKGTVRDFIEAYKRFTS